MTEVFVSVLPSLLGSHGVYLTHIDLINSFFSGESTKVKAEKVEAVVVPQGNYQ